MVWQILLRARFASESNVSFLNAHNYTCIVYPAVIYDEFFYIQQVGIRKLLSIGAYISAFPLHEGKYDEDTDFGFTYDRRVSKFFSKLYFFLSLSIPRMKCCT